MNGAYFFWKPPSLFCNWTTSPFTYDNVKYDCAEQAIMHQKALLFKDTEMGKAIMCTSSPRKQKALGRKVSAFNESIWMEHINKILPDILLAKFVQNEMYPDELLRTGNKMLFEASPFDKIWGIGLTPEQAARCDQSRGKKWNESGRNLLGRTLEQVRERLKNSVQAVGNVTVTSNHTTTGYI